LAAAKIDCLVTDGLVTDGLALTARSGVVFLAVVLGAVFLARRALATLVDGDLGKAVLLKTCSPTVTAPARLEKRDWRTFSRCAPPMFLGRFVVRESGYVAAAR
jgi:hypothetical protein